MDRRRPRRGARPPGSAAGRSPTGIARRPGRRAVDPKVLDAGPARLKVSTDWAAGARAPVLPGLDNAPAYMPYSRADDDRVGRAAARPTRPSLVPDALRGEGRRAACRKAETARVVGLQARAYRGVRTGDSVLDVYAIPTTPRRADPRLHRPATAPRTAPTWCLEGSTRSRSRAPAPLSPRPPAYRMRAPAAMKQLDAARVRERAALRRPRARSASARAASRLSRLRAAADGSAPLAPQTGLAAARVVTSRCATTARALRGARRAAAPAEAGLARAPADVARPSAPLESRAARRPSGLERAAAGERAAERDLVGVLEVAADRQPGGEARDRDVGRALVQRAGDVQRRRLAGRGRVRGQHDLADAVVTRA